MAELPFEIPESLASYAEHFENNPVKATKRLEKQLQKRGPDAVGHFLLAWFYHQRGRKDQAVDEALKAKIFAPGSPFFKKLHYYYSHPQTFDAWTPESSASPNKQKESPTQHGPVLNLDNLIQKLSAVESERLTPNGDADKVPLDGKSSGSSENIDNLVSETLAEIHVEQGKFETAIKMYKQLKKTNTDKEEQFEKKIRQLEKQKEAKNQEE
ncbi:Tetratricopeptide repeat-containing protein [Fodinibius salinus]|uniref:Tetratricopeptide repeat-containing protein n=1 Tax=Fodinibius salinus TaxID=860790 RepID=A0A5D3YNB8_9BACT|nr:tetratricopeptide repeat protein [Fodinibius salinus]TYP95277.1 Tetratricopeptide repeat-containing protein [Fodinibius salinus]